MPWGSRFKDITAARKTRRRLKSFLHRLAFLRKRGEGLEEMPSKALFYLDRSAQVLKAAIERKGEVIRRAAPPERDAGNDLGSHAS